jgi:hypothetical protein
MYVYIASKDGGRLHQLVLYRDAPASDFLGGKTFAAECPQYTWPNLLRGYCRLGGVGRYAWHRGLCVLTDEQHT